MLQLHGVYSHNTDCLPKPCCNNYLKTGGWEVFPMADMRTESHSIMMSIHSEFNWIQTTSLSNLSLILEQCECNCGLFWHLAFNLSQLKLTKNYFMFHFSMYLMVTSNSILRYWQRRTLTLLNKCSGLYAPCT